MLVPVLAVGWLLFVVDSPLVRDEVDGADSVEEADTSFSIPARSRRAAPAPESVRSFFIRRRQQRAPTHCYGNGEEGHAHHDADECQAANICGAIGALQRRHFYTAVRKSGCRDIGADGDQWRRCGRRW